MQDLLSIGWFYLQYLLIVVFYSRKINSPYAAMIIYPNGKRIIVPKTPAKKPPSHIAIIIEIQKTIRNIKNTQAVMLKNQ